MKKVTIIIPAYNEEESLPFLRERLNELINKAESLNAANYTIASWNSLQNTLNDVKVVFENPEATVEEVTNAQSAIEAAIANLVTNSNNSVDLNTDSVKSSLKDTAIKTGDATSFAGVTSLDVS